MHLPTHRPRYTAVLVVALALFIAENFEHMHYEETEHNAVLWAHYTDAELAELPDTVFADMVSRLREEVLTPSSEPVSAFTSALDPAAGERERTRERS